MGINNLSFQTLTKLIYEFYDYMGRDKKPGNERVELWFRDLKKLEEKDVFEAFDYMKTTLDSLPHNIPKAIKRAVWEINKEKPIPKPEFGTYGRCDDCNSTGIFKLRIMTPQGRWYEPIRFCSQCDNWKLWVSEPGIRVSAAELEAEGTRFKPYNVCLLNSEDVEGLGDFKKFKSLAGIVSDGMNVNLAKKALNERGNHENLSNNTSAKTKNDTA